MSLREQLKKLQFSEQSLHFNRHASLLFSEDQASRMDLETVRALGANGLEQLKQKNSRFEEFDSLFALASAQLNRSMLTASQAKELNTQIESFLALLSPVFQLPAAHKALEWMIRRYQVHQMNVADLLRHFLPYHSTKVFIRLVQLLDIKIDDALWSFLKPFQKSGAVIERETLVRRATMDGNFLHFLCKFVSDFASAQLADVSQIANLWMSVLTGVFETNGTADHVQKSLPAIVAAIKSEHANFRAAAYVVLCAIARKHTLVSEVLDGLVELVVLSVAAPTTSQSLSCLAFLAQTQNPSILSETLLVHLCAVDNWTVELSVLADRFNLQPLLLFLVRSMLSLSIHSSSIASTLLDLFVQCRFSKDSIEHVGNELFVEYSQRHRQITASEAKTRKSSMADLTLFSTSVLKALERQHPAILDHVVTKHSRHELLQSFIKLSLGGLRHLKADDASLSLFLGLQHHDAQVRTLALGELKTTLENLGSTSSSLAPEDHHFFQRVVLDVLTGSHDTSVIVSALELGPWLGQLITTDSLVSALTTLIKSPNSHASVVGLATSVLFSHLEASRADEVAVALVDILILTQSRMKASRAMIKSIAALQSPPALFIGFDSLVAGASFQAVKKDKAPNLIAAFNQDLTQCLAQNALAFADRFFEIVTEIPRLSSSLRACVVLILSLVVAKAQPSTGTYHQSILLLLKFATPVLSRLRSVVTPSLPVVSSSCSDFMIELQQFVESSRFNVTGDSLETSVHLHMLADVTRVMQFVDWPSDYSSQPPANQLEILEALFGIATVHNNARVFAAILQTLFLKVHRRGHFAFLAYIWTKDDTPMQVRLAAVSMAGVLMKAQTSSNLVECCVIAARLVGVLHSPVAHMRLAALQTLRSLSHLLLTATDNRSTVSIFPSTIAAPVPTVSVVRKFLEIIDSSNEEISNDSEHIVRLAAEHFSTSFIVEHSSSQKRTSKPSLSHFGEFLLFLLASALHFEDILLLECMKQVQSHHKTVFTVPKLQGLLKSAQQVGFQQLSEVERQIIQSLILALDDGEQNSFLPDSVELQAWIASCSFTNSSTLNNSPQFWAISLVTPSLFQRLQQSVAQVVFSNLCEIIHQQPGSEVATLARTILSRVQLSATLAATSFSTIVKEEQESEQVSSQPIEVETSRGSKKRIMPDSSSIVSSRAPIARQVVSGLSLTKIRKLEVLLEVLLSQSATQISDVTSLLSVLFELLDTVLLSDALVLASADHVTQLILNFLQNIYSANENSPSSNLYVNVESVVRSIRGSNNPQTHHFALLLLAQIAVLFPDRVLNSIMPIFTFMGVHVVRHDDNYSFRVIQRTIETVIPALLSSTKTSAKATHEVSTIVSSIVNVFVDAFDHIPKHRRLSLFTHLIRTLSAKEHLYILCALLLKKLVFLTKSKAKQSETDDFSSSADEEAQLLEFIFLINNEFSVPEQVSMLSQLLNILIKLPLATGSDQTPKKPTKLKQPTFEFSFLLELSEFSEKQLRHLKYRMVSYILSHLGERKFLIKVGGGNKQLSSPADQAQNVYLSMLETLLVYVGDLKDQLTHATANRTPLVDFWQAMIGRVYDIIDRVNGLLNVDDFVQVVDKLIEHTDTTIRRKVMTLFGTRVSIGCSQGDFNEEEINQLLAIVPKLMEAAVGPESDLSTDTILTRQTALFNLNILVSSFGSTHPDSLAPVVTCVSNLLIEHSKVQNHSKELVGSALTCLATLCVRLGNHVLASLPMFLPVLLSFLEASLNVPEDTKESMVQHGSVAALLVVIKSLPQFLSPYMSRILVLMSHPSISPSASSKLKDRQDAISIAQKIRLEIPTRIALRVLLPAFFEGHHSLLKTSSGAKEVEEKSLIEFLALFAHTIKLMDKKDVPTFYKNVFKFFLVVVDYRAACSNVGFASSHVDMVEKYAISAFIELVMKLSDSLFHPLFLKVVDWSIQPDVPAERAIILLKVTDQLASTLKSLFVPYFGHILKFMIEILSGTSTVSSGLLAHDLNSLAKVSCLVALQKCFLYDAENFLTKERFQGLLNPIINQLKFHEEDIDDDEDDDDLSSESDVESDANSDTESTGANGERGQNRPSSSSQGQRQPQKKHLTYHARVDAAIPCVAQLCVAARSVTHRKSLNHAVLMLTRDKSSMVRCSALRAIDECYGRLGDDFLSFLPETVPFIAELLEDDNIEVERQCKKLIGTIEAYLGESLSKYF